MSHKTFHREGKTRPGSDGSGLEKDKVSLHVVGMELTE